MSRAQLAEDAYFRDGGTQGREMAAEQLPGTGKSRTLTGASGTKVWVRFARVRGQLQSDWSVPVLVTIP